MFIDQKKLTDTELRDKIEEATYFGDASVSSKIKSVSRYNSDSDKIEREKLCLCKKCYYLDSESFAFSAITKTCCISCGVEMTFGSSNINKLCPICSKKYKSCVNCLMTLSDKRTKSGRVLWK